jgi:catechol 2,3-dioxygenase-like lactoylglutathione lyase family enzyme
MLSVNIPVADLERSKAFFATLGFSYDPRFTDDTAACMPVGEHAVFGSRVPDAGRPGDRLHRGRRHRLIRQPTHSRSRQG